MRNVFACLVHEQPECIMDLVRNLRRLDPESAIVVYNGSGDPALLEGLPLNCAGAVCVPDAVPMRWGFLHEFALRSMRFALRELPFDTLTIVDSDQLALREGYTAHIANAIRGTKRLGMLVNSPGRQPATTQIGPARAAYREWDMWMSFLRRFRGGERKFVHWSFWPATVFTADAVRALLPLFEYPQLQEILSHSWIWASEEVVFPTLAVLVGFELVEHPCNYEYIRYRVLFRSEHLENATKDPRAFWMHPVPRCFDNPLRQHVRQKWNQYAASPNK
jgi:hypothetical protein